MSQFSTPVQLFTRGSSSPYQIVVARDGGPGVSCDGQHAFSSGWEAGGPWQTPGTMKLHAATGIIPTYILPAWLFTFSEFQAFFPYPMHLLLEGPGPGLEPQALRWFKGPSIYPTAKEMMICTMENWDRHS